jgi:hypothetical protein
MATDYGLDLLAGDDLTDPEQFASGDLNVTYALVRRWLTPTGALDEIGDPGPYDSIDTREWLGNRFSLSDPGVLDDLQAQAQAVLVGDPRVETATATVTYAAGVLTLTGEGVGTAGPFKLVLAIDGVTTTVLRGG